jgi:hypothetical protein
MAYTMLLIRISSFAPTLYNKNPCRLYDYSPATLPAYFLLLKRHRGLLQELWRGDIHFLHRPSLSRNKQRSEMPGLMGVIFRNYRVSISAKLSSLLLRKHYVALMWGGVKYYSTFSLTFDTCWKWIVRCVVPQLEPPASSFRYTSASSLGRLHCLVSLDAVGNSKLAASFGNQITEYLGHGSFNWLWMNEWINE